MKIGIVTPTYYPYPGGVPEHVYHTYVELARGGHDVRVVTTSFGPGDAPNEQHVIRIGRSVSVPANGSMCPVAFGVGMRARIRETLARESFDLLHIHEPLMPTLCLAVLAEAGCPTVGTFHANNDGAVGYRMFRPILEPHFRKLSARIAVSREAERTVREHFGGEYVIVPNGVDVERFASAEPIPELRDGSFNILFVGRMEPRKGAKHLFRALGSIAREVPSVRLVVVGGGPLTRYYRSFVPESVADRVVFTGRVSGEMLARHYATADVFCSPATGGESFGIVLIEAMAAGAAVVASDIPGYRDVVEDGVTGLLTRRAAPESIAEAIASLARSDAIRRSLIESARRDVRQYSWHRVTARIFGVYQSVLSAPRGEGPEGASGGGDGGAVEDKDRIEVAVS
jgi:phosphatidylinositol alpha-mannosyltransferase